MAFRLHQVLRVWFIQITINSSDISSLKMYWDVVRIEKMLNSWTTFHNCYISFSRLHCIMLDSEQLNCRCNKYVLKVNFYIFLIYYYINLPPYATTHAGKPYICCHETLLSQPFRMISLIQSPNLFINSNSFLSLWRVTWHINVGVVSQNTVVIKALTFQSCLSRSWNNYLLR